MKKVYWIVLVLFVLGLASTAWADIKPKTTTATRDIVLVEDAEGDVDKKDKAETEGQVLDAQEMHKNDFGVTLTSGNQDKGDVYNIKDKLTLTFTSEKDCYLTLLDFTSGGQILVLFPNKWVENNFVKAGQEIKIPAEGQKYSMLVGGPVGVDVLKAIATSKPTQVINPANQELVGPFSILKDTKTATRDILLVEDSEEDGTPVEGTVSADKAVAAGAATSEAPLQWSVASLAIMTEDAKNPDEPKGFAIVTNGEWTVKMWVSQPSYLVGEAVFVKFMSNQPAKLASLVNLGASAAENNLLPEGTSVAFVPGDVTILPGKDHKWKLVAASKIGKDTIKAKLAKDSDGTEMDITLEVMVEE